jgi:ketosteroid isomerase-like protein
MNIAMAQSKEEAAVTAAVENLKKAMIDGDKAGLQNITADQLSYGHSSGRVEDKATFVDNIVSGKSDFVTIDLTNQTIAISGDAAIVRHTLAATTNDGGNPGSVKLNILLIWQKQKGQWKLLARQAVKVAS